MIDDGHAPPVRTAPIPRFLRDGSYRRPGHGVTLVGGSPLRLFRLGAAGVRVARAIEEGVELPAGHGPLTDRLVDAGVLHPEPDLSLGADPSQLTVVIPAYGEWPRVLDGSSGGWPLATIVVDDASEPRLCPPGTAPARWTLIRLDANGGPGVARNAGLAAVDTPFVAFVDTDVAVDAAALVALTAHFGDGRVALVAPRVRADDARGRLARFERVRSPLDMGAEPARVAPTTRVSYVPAAVIVCRTDAVRAVGGFDPTLRYGEDVDLVWRLVANGWRCRYEPRCTATHRTRPTVREWLLQRFRYGTSAAPLAARHHGALAPVRMSPWSAAAWAAVALGWPVVGPLIGALIAAVTAATLVRKLPQLPARESLRLAGLGHLYAGRLLCSTLTRTWWPVGMALALVSRRARQLALVAAMVPLVTDLVRDRRAAATAATAIDPISYGALHLLDDLAYGAGVWTGSLRERRADALLPTLETWPPRVPST